jgi:hypothetical protein
MLSKDFEEDRDRDRKRDWERDNHESCQDSEATFREIDQEKDRERYVLSSLSVFLFF